jgi:hypothetical protein
MREVYGQMLEKMEISSRRIPSEAYDEDPSSIKSEDRTTLGTIVIDEAQTVFEPKSDIVFTVDIPPFQSLLIDRVLTNMRSADERRVTAGARSRKWASEI